MSSVGVNVGVMTTAQENLSKYSEEISSLVEELETLKNQLPAHWQGDDLELFTASFVEFKSKLQDLPMVISEISKWTGETSQKYVDSSLVSSANLSSIFGGAGV